MDSAHSSNKIKNFLPWTILSGAQLPLTLPTPAARARCGCPQCTAVGSGVAAADRRGGKGWVSKVSFGQRVVRTPEECGSNHSLSKDFENTSWTSRRHFRKCLREVLWNHLDKEWLEPLWDVHSNGVITSDPSPRGGILLFNVLRRLVKRLRVLRRLVKRLGVRWNVLDLFTLWG